MGRRCIQSEELDALLHEEVCGFNAKRRIVLEIAVGAKLFVPSGVKKDSASTFYRISVGDECVRAKSVTARATDTRDRCRPNAAGEVRDSISSLTAHSEVVSARSIVSTCIFIAMWCEPRAGHLSLR